MMSVEKRWEKYFHSSRRGLAAVQLVNALIKLAIKFLLGARLQRDLFMMTRSKVFSTLRNHLAPFINLHFPAKREKHVCHTFIQTDGGGGRRIKHSESTNNV